MHARPKKPHPGHSSKAQQAKSNPSMTPGKSNEPLRVRTMHLSDGHQKRFERVETVTPQGFQPLLDKILRAVLNARPLHVLMFVAEYLDAEISRRTFDDMCYGCQLRKCQYTLKLLALHELIIAYFPYYGHMAASQLKGTLA